MPADRVPEIRIYVTFEPPSDRYRSGRNYGHIYARPMILGESKFEPGQALFSPGSYEVEPRPAAKWKALDNLQASAQFDDDSERVYGSSVEYDERPAVTLHRAEQMILWLRKLDKHMTEISRAFGYPQDFPAYLAHFAQALIPKTPRPFWRDLDGQPDIEGTGYRAMDAESLRWWINGQMTEYRKNAGLPAHVTA
jgi:hypothetical protein